MDNCLNCVYEDCVRKFERGDKCSSYKKKPPIEKEVEYTEYAVEVNNEKGFVRQIEVFASYEQAENFADSYKEPLDDDEYLNIIFIDYDKNGDEIRFGTVC